MVISVLNDYNVCVFADVPTGTWKAFTMECTEDNIGVNYMTREELFNIEKGKNKRFKLDNSLNWCA